MKTSNIVSLFTTKHNDKPLIIFMFDTIKKFNRIVELRPTLKGIKDIYTLFKEQGQKIIVELIQRHCDEVNAKDPRANATVESIGQVPGEFMSEYERRVKEILDTDIQLDIVKFTEDEVSNAVENHGVLFSHLEIMENFIPFQK